MTKNKLADLQDASPYILPSIHRQTHMVHDLLHVKVLTANVLVSFHTKQRLAISFMHNIHYI